MEATLDVLLVEGSASHRKIPHTHFTHTFVKSIRETVDVFSISKWHYITCGTPVLTCQMLSCILRYTGKYIIAYEPLNSLNLDAISLTE